MNQFNSNSARCIKTAAAILLLQVNLALAAEPAPQQASAPAPAAQQAPATDAAQTPAPTVTVGGQIPFNEMLRPSRNPINAYRGADRRATQPVQLPASRFADPRRQALSLVAELHRSGA